MFDCLGHQPPRSSDASAPIVLGELNFIDDDTLVDPIPTPEAEFDPDERQVIPQGVILLLIGVADVKPRPPDRNLRDTTCPWTGRPCTAGCFDRR